MLRQSLPLLTRLCAGNCSGRVTASHLFNTILNGKLSAGVRKKPKMLISLEQMTVKNSYSLELCIADMPLCAQITHQKKISELKFDLTVSLRVLSTSKPPQCPVYQWQANKAPVVPWWHSHLSTTVPEAVQPVIWGELSLAASAVRFLLHPSKLMMLVFMVFSDTYLTLNQVERTLTQVTLIHGFTRGNWNFYG